MLRFVQGIHKVFRSNQAYAPCQKAAHDQEEFDSRLGDSLPQKRCYGGLASTPLSQPLPVCSNADVPHDEVATRTSSYRKESRSTEFTPPNGLLPGALLGAGYVVFNTLHGLCGGRGQGRPDSKEKPKLCPATYYQTLHNNFLLRSLHSLTPRSYRLTTDLGVLPKSSARRRVTSAAAVEVSDASSITAADEDDKALRQKEFEKAKDEVTSLADRLGSIDEDNLAADHFLAMRAWKSRDFAAAASLWHRTVEKFATPIAAHRLGVIYEQGQGVPRDYEQASAYYHMAISHQCSRAMYRQAMLQMNGLVDGETDSMDLITQSAHLGYAKAQTYLGTVYFHRGRKQLAVEYFQKAANQKDVDAYFYLGICYETGDGVPTSDDTKAAECYKMAAEGGNAEAQYNLAMFYEEGLGCLDVDEELAIHWLEKAAQQGNKNAKDRLKELGQWSMASSASLPAISKHLPSTLSDLSVHEVMRVYSDNSLVKRHGVTPSLVREGSLSKASSSSSLAGTPQFYIPKDDEDDDSSTASFGDWSDEGLSSASSSSLRLDHQKDKFSVEFALENTSYNPTMYNTQGRWQSRSNSSLYRPDHDGPNITFA